ncbi:MAG: recombinase RecF, partial [Acidobacteria bacterium]
RVRLQRKRPPKRVIIGFENEDFGYELQIGLPSQNEHALATMFTLDPRVKEEYIWPSETKRRVLMLKRDEPSAWLRDAEGKMISYPFKISKSESALSQIDPRFIAVVAAARVSDGQLRFCLCAALLSPRPPSLLALNEPETSLHPDLIDSLARLIVLASKHTQL